MGRITRQRGELQALVVGKTEVFLVITIGRPAGCGRMNRYLSLQWPGNEEDKKLGVVDLI
jgi:hypothetical protein